MQHVRLIRLLFSQGDIGQRWLIFQGRSHDGGFHSLCNFSVFAFNANVHLVASVNVVDGF